MRSAGAVHRLERGADACGPAVKNSSEPQGFPLQQRRAGFRSSPLMRVDLGSPDPAKVDVLIRTRLRRDERENSGSPSWNATCFSSPPRGVVELCSGSKPCRGISVRPRVGARSGAGQVGKANVSTAGIANGNRNRQDPKRRWTAVVMFITVSMASLGCSGCRRPWPDGEMEATERLARSLATSSVQSCEGIDVYLDVSASMRGFALASTAAERPNDSDFQSVLAFAASLEGMNDFVVTPEAQTTGGPKPAEAPPRFRSFSFGTAVRPLEDLSRISSFASNSTPRSPAASNASRDCVGGRGWGGAPATRDAIDGTFAENVTCLEKVFEQALSSGRKRLSVIITDAEQVAPRDSDVCSGGRNAGSIPQSVADWVRNGAGYGAAVALRCRSRGWESRDIGTTYCGCDERMLSVYLLGPSPDVVEKAYLQLSRFWKGPDSISYLPLVTRAAGEYAVSLVIGTKEGESSSAGAEDERYAVPSVSSGAVPFYAVRLHAQKARLQIRVADAVFEHPNLAGAPGYEPPAWGKAEYQWSERPLRYRLASSEDGSAATLEPEGASGVLVFQKRVSAGDDLDPETGGRHAGWWQEQHFLGRGASAIDRSPVQEEGRDPGKSAAGAAKHRSAAPSGEAGVSTSIPPVEYVVSTTQGARAGTAETYLFELRAAAPNVLDSLAAGSPSKFDTGCSGIQLLRDQMKYTYHPAPVIRVLIRFEI